MIRLRYMARKILCIVLLYCIVPQVVNRIASDSGPDTVTVSRFSKPLTPSGRSVERSVLLLSLGSSSSFHHQSEMLRPPRRMSTVRQFYIHYIQYGGWQSHVNFDQLKRIKSMIYFQWQFFNKSHAMMQTSDARASQGLIRIF